MLDHVVDGLLWFYFLFLTIRAIARWIRRGRVESYSQADLMPKWLRSWLIGEPRPDNSVPQGFVRGPVTLWGWVFIAVVLGWLLVKTI